MANATFGYVNPNAEVNDMYTKDFGHPLAVCMQTTGPRLYQILEMNVKMVSLTFLPHGVNLIVNKGVN